MHVNWVLPTDVRDYNKITSALWIRCLQLLPYLEERGVECTVNENDADPDVSVFVRMQDRKAYELAKKRAEEGDAVVFDLCVNYLDEANIPHLDGPVTEKHIRECRRMLKVADAVSCASRAITDRVAEEHPRAVYLPDSIDSSHFDSVKEHGLDDGSPPVAIWSGVSVKAVELEPVVPLLRERDIPLAIISDRRPKLEAPDVRWFWKRHWFDFVKWRYETFPESILHGDFTIVHRNLDNPYNRGHSHFKIAVFMAQGVPAICSPVPSYQDVVEDGVNGRICHDRSDWENALDSVVETPRRLQQWSQPAREAVEPHLTENVVDDYIDLFQELTAA